MSIEEFLRYAWEYLWIADSYGQTTKGAPPARALVELLWTHLHVFPLDQPWQYTDIGYSQKNNLLWFTRRALAARIKEEKVQPLLDALYAGESFFEITTTAAKRGDLLERLHNGVTLYRAADGEPLDVPYWTRNAWRATKKDRIEYQGLVFNGYEQHRKHWIGIRNDESLDLLRLSAETREGKGQYRIFGPEQRASVLRGDVQPRSLLLDYTRPLTWRVEKSALVVTNHSGIERWRKDFGQRLMDEEGPDHYPRHVFHTADLDGDGKREVLFIETPQSGGRTLWCFSEDGQELWRFLPQRTYLQPSHSTVEPLLSDFAVGSIGRMSTLRIVVTSITHYGTCITMLDPAGAVLAEYVSSGFLSSLELADVNRDGYKEIIAAGRSGTKATLIVLDPENMDGVAEELETNNPLMLPKIEELARLVFPRIYTAPWDLFARGRADCLSVKGNTLTVRVFFERYGKREEQAAEYSFSIDLRLKAVTRTARKIEQNDLQLRDIAFAKPLKR